MTLYYIAQVHIVLAGALSLWLVSSHPSHGRNWWGFALGVWNQWAWVYIAVHTESWGILGTSTIHLAAYLRGLRNFWRQQT